MRGTRIPAIKSYILDNPAEYLFSSVTASVDGEMRFEPAPHLGPDGKMGRLYIDMNARMLLNDGQHRCKAIDEALSERPDLGSESISIVFFEDKGLQKCQQMFADLNKNASKPSKSLNILYDRRDPYSSFIVEMTENVEIFKDRVDMENTTIGKNATEMFTLAGIADATRKLLGKNKIRRMRQEQKSLALEYWKTVADNMPDWQLVIDGDATPNDLRANFVHTNTNCLYSLGIAGKVIVETYPDTWKRVLRRFRTIDWTRDNKAWQGTLLQGKHMVRTTTGTVLGAIAILNACNVRIPRGMEALRN